MMMLLTFVLAAALIAALLWLLLGPQRRKLDPAAQALEIKSLLPRHFQHFPQIGHTLKPDDQEFMRRRAPRELSTEWRKQRTRILRLYIRALAQDFRGLEQLARLVAALSPEVTRRQEWEWLLLGLQFRLLYRMTLLRVSLHRLPPDEMGRLAEMVTSLAMKLERWTDRLTEGLPQAGIAPRT